MTLFPVKYVLVTLFPVVCTCIKTLKILMWHIIWLRIDCKLYYNIVQCWKLEEDWKSSSVWNRFKNPYLKTEGDIPYNISSKVTTCVAYPRKLITQRKTKVSNWYWNLQCMFLVVYYIEWNIDSVVKGNFQNFQIVKKKIIAINYQWYTIVLRVQ